MSHWARLAYERTGAIDGHHRAMRLPQAQERNDVILCCQATVEIARLIDILNPIWRRFRDA